MRWVGPTARPPGASESNGTRDSWGGWLAKLEAYKRSHGDCNVPVTWAKDPRLGKWVRHQRTRKKALDRGEPSERMTAAKLDALGFAWSKHNTVRTAIIDVSPPRPRPAVMVPASLSPARRQGRKGKFGSPFKKGEGKRGRRPGSGSRPGANGVDKRPAADVRGPPRRKLRSSHYFAPHCRFGAAMPIKIARHGPGPRCAGLGQLRGRRGPANQTGCGTAGRRS